MTGRRPRASAGEGVPGPCACSRGARGGGVRVARRDFVAEVFPSFPVSGVGTGLVRAGPCGRRPCGSARRAGTRGLAWARAGPPGRLSRVLLPSLSRSPRRTPPAVGRGPREPGPAVFGASAGRSTRPRPKSQLGGAVDRAGAGRLPARANGGGRVPPPPSPPRLPPPPLPPGFGGRPEGPAAPPGSRDGVLTGVRWPRLLPRRPPRPVDSALVEGRGNCLRLRSTFCATREVWAGCPPVAVLGGGRVFSARACGGPSWALGRRPTPGLSPPPLVYVGLCRVPALVQPRRPGGTAADPSGLQHPRVAAGAVSGGRDAARGEKDAGLSALRRVRPPVPSPAAQAERGSWSRWPGPACRAWQAFPSRGALACPACPRGRRGRRGQEPGSAGHRPRRACAPGASPGVPIDVVTSRSPGPGLSRARRGTDIPGEWDRSSRSAPRAPRLARPPAGRRRVGRGGVRNPARPRLPRHPASRRWRGRGLLTQRTRSALGPCARVSRAALSVAGRRRSAAALCALPGSSVGAPGALQDVSPGA